MGASICSAILLWHEKKQRHIGEHHSEESKKGETDSFETDNQTVTNTQDALDSIPKQTIPISNDEPDRFVCHHSPPSTVNLSYSPLIHEPNSPYEGLQRPVSTIIAPYTPSPLIMSPQAPLQQPYYSSDNLPNVAHVHGNSAYYSSPHATANLPYQSLHSPYSSSDYSNTNMSYPFNPSHYASQ
ncbi:hypothetical protein A0J61_04764 [Choanephora cucurbitarum]|uniref:Uncharacterized protein n=1 Tax=Choanephora cucurbitarum TaxID=101091 RepID=A0A1C7NE24_9FUNG|nr:hypothetical protein A0J61_04764 [Choanephora cucurbitarum]